MKILWAKLCAKVYAWTHPGWYVHYTFDGASGRLRLVGAMNPALPWRLWKTFYLLPGRD